jgi:peptide/nickel transport system permease protein
VVAQVDVAADAVETGASRIPRFLRERSGKIGVALAAFALLVAFVGPYVAPQDPNTTIGVPFTGPSSDSPLGTDFIGRDVLSRVLDGGQSVILLSLLATLIAYAIGLTAGLIAGYKRSWRDSALMRGADILLAFPPLIFLLVVASGAGHSLFALVLAIGIIQSPGLARIMRSAVLDIAQRSYVEAATIRGEGSFAILRREILPNLTYVIAADVGLRLTYSVLLFASISFLGFGVQPPQADWPRMISENRIALATQPWGVLAPAIMLGIFLVAVNMICDAIARTSGVSVEALEAGGGVR